MFHLFINMLGWALGLLLRLKMLIVFGRPWLPRNPTCEKTVILIRDDALGDAIISLYAFRLLYEYFHQRGYKLILVHSPKTRELFADCPYFSEKIEVPSRPSNSFYRKLSGYHAEIAVRMPSIFGSAASSLFLTIFTNAKRRIALRPRQISDKSSAQYLKVTPRPGIIRNFCDRLLTKRQKLQILDSLRYDLLLKYFTEILTPPRQITTVSQNEALIVSHLTGTAVPPGLQTPFWLDTGIESVKALPANAYLIVAGCGGRERTWPEENFAKLIDLIYRQNNLLIPVFVGTASEASIARDVCAKLTAPLEPINRCGQTTLSQLLQYIRESKFVISNDTGTSHLAASIGKQTAIILGGGHYGIYAPNPLYHNTTVIANQDWQCIHCNWLCHKMQDGRFPCICNISPESVFDSIRKWL